MAGKVISLSNVESSHALGRHKFILDDDGYVLGFHHENGSITMLPAAKSVTGVTAFGGGGQANATALPYSNVNVDTVVTAGDSVILPVGVQGLRMQIHNRTANSLNLFPSVGEAINVLAANTAIAIVASGNSQAICLTPNLWIVS